MGHSFGNTHILHALTKKMNQSEKDAKVEQFIAVAPPFLGAIKTLRN